MTDFNLKFKTEKAPYGAFLFGITGQLHGRRPLCAFDRYEIEMLSIKKGIHIMDAL